MYLRKKSSGVVSGFASIESSNPVHIYGDAIPLCICIQIPARCPLFSSLDCANDYVHSPIVAPLRALRMR